MEAMDEKKFIRNFERLSEDIITFYKSMRQEYGNIDNMLVLLSVSSRVKNQMSEAVQNSSNYQQAKEQLKTLLKANEDTFGVNISGISRETDIPRTTVRRICDQLIQQGMLKRNKRNLIIPDFEYRQQNQVGRHAMNDFFRAIVNKFEL